MTLVTAHRGDSSRLRENTIAAINSAITHHADIVEVDIRKTSDGQVILLHDQTLERLWGVPLKASELTLEQIREIGFGEFRIPTLKEAISIFGACDSLLMIDMDDPAIASDAFQVVSESSLDSEKVLWCGNLDAMRIIRGLSTQARIWLPWNENKPLNLQLVSELTPEFINSHYSFWNRNNVEEVHQLGLKASAWTIDDAPTMRWAKSIGIDSVTTNKLELFQNIELPAEPSGSLNLELASEVAVAIGSWAIQVCKWMAPGTVNTKVNPADLVTEVDLFIESHAREVILANFPTHNIVGEEFGGSFDEDKPTWYIDPVDGTTNFANRTPWSSMSLALAIGRVPLVAVTIDPWREKLFHAVKGGGATVNGSPMKSAYSNEIPSETALAGKLLLTELAGSAPWHGMFAMIEALNNAYCTTRIMGAGTLTLTAVSANHGIGAIVHRFSPIDHLAAALIADESGCVVYNEKGEHDLFPTSGGLMIAHPHAAPQLYTLWTDAIS
jgi:myo-inositol-1(or 4)-monophosphatase/deoxyribonuclease-2